MSALSDYAEAKILNRILNAGSDTEWPQIASVYVALYTAAPSDAGGGTEVTGGSYARAQVTAGWTVTAVGHAENTSDINFPTASASWGTVTHFAILDASSGGNFLMHGALPSSVEVDNGAQPKFLATELQLDFSGTGFLSDYAEEKVLNRILNAQADAQWAVIATVYVALFTVAEDDTGASGTEVTGGSYARAAVTADWTVSGGGANNTSDITFTQATASWGTIVGLGIFDASSGGNLLIYGAVQTSKPVASGGIAKFAAATLNLTLD